MDILPVEKFFRGVLITTAAGAVVVGGMVCLHVVKMPGEHRPVARTTPAPLPSLYLDKPDAAARKPDTSPEPSTFSFPAAGDSRR